jgi:hypothetical protein
MTEEEPRFPAESNCGSRKRTPPCLQPVRFVTCGHASGSLLFRPESCQPIAMAPRSFSITSKRSPNRFQSSEKIMRDLGNVIES